MRLTFDSLDKDMFGDLFSAGTEKAANNGVHINVKQGSTLLFQIMLYKVIFSFESVDENLKCGIQMKASTQYFPMVLFIMLHMVVLTFESVDEFLKCDHSHGSCRTVVSCVIFAFSFLSV